MLLRPAAAQQQNNDLKLCVRNDIVDHLDELEGYRLTVIATDGSRDSGIVQGLKGVVYSPMRGGGLVSGIPEKPGSDSMNSHDNEQSTREDKTERAPETRVSPPPQQVHKRFPGWLLAGALLLLLLGAGAAAWYLWEQNKTSTATQVADPTSVAEEPVAAQVSDSDSEAIKPDEALGSNSTSIAEEPTETQEADSAFEAEEPIGDQMSDSGNPPDSPADLSESPDETVAPPAGDDTSPAATGEETATREEQPAVVSTDASPAEEQAPPEVLGADVTPAPELDQEPSPVDQEPEYAGQEQAPSKEETEQRPEAPAAPELTPMQMARAFLRDMGRPEQALELGKTFPDTPEGRDAAFLVLEAAADGGMSEAMLLLGGYYDPLDTAPSGTIQKDPEQAVRLYDQAKVFGHPEAGKRLEALRNWLNQQANQGNTQARELLSRMR